MCLAAPQSHSTQFVGQISSIMAENIRKRDIGAAFGAKPAAEVRLTASCFVSELNLKRRSNMYSSLNSGFII